ncbi:MAG: GNAT family N-acetyltransferase [Thermomicrobiales bacterium]
MAFIVRPVTAADRDWITQLLRERWGATLIVSRGQVHDAAALPGVVAATPAGLAGLATYRIAGDECELVTLDSLAPGQGIGTGLIAVVRAAAVAAGCRRLWLITTNDNLPALRFYQRRGFVLAALHRDAIAASRRLKPQIPLLGLDNIPIRDELELEMAL